MTTAQRVAIYARISQDTTGKALGVQDQLSHGHAFAATRGYRVIGDFSDNDISAFRGKSRPGYLKVLDLARARKIDRVVVFHLSRLTRNRRERAEFIDDFHTAGVSVSEAQGGDYDLSTASGRSWADIQGALSTWESEVKSERVTAAAVRRARGGRPNGALGYGWTTTGRGADATFTVNEDEAAIVREIVVRLLSGDSLLAVTNDLNARGIPAPGRAQVWGKTSVKKIALRPSNVALRLHHRGQRDEQMFDGDWPGLLPRTKWDKVTALLTAPQRRSNGAARPGARKHLLTWGIGSCGVCGAHLRVALRGNQQHGVKKHLYVCESKGCVGRDQERVDDLVTRTVIARLAQPDALDWMLGTEDDARQARERVGALRRRLDDAADRYADDKITAEQLERITAKLRPQIEDSEAEQRRHTVTLDVDALAALAVPEAADRWEAMTVPQRRAVVSVLIDGVRIMPVTRRGPGFDPTSVRIDWAKS